VLRHRQPLTTAITPRSIGRRCGRSPGPGSAVRHERPARRAHRLPDHPAHALGYKLERTEKLLCQFLDYLDEHELERVTTGRRSAWTAPTSTSTTASSPCARASSASRGSCRCTPRLWRRSTATSADAIGCARRQRAKPCSSLASAAACSTATSTGRSCGSSSAPACGPARPLPAPPARPAPQLRGPHRARLVPGRRRRAGRLSACGHAHPGRSRTPRTTLSVPHHRPREAPGRHRSPDERRGTLASE
jgi:hypothetical protein